MTKWGRTCIWHRNRNWDLMGCGKGGGGLLQICGWVVGKYHMCTYTWTSIIYQIHSEENTVLQLYPLMRIMEGNKEKNRWMHIKASSSSHQFTVMNCQLKTSSETLWCETNKVRKKKTGIFYLNLPPPQKKLNLNNPYLMR